MDDVSNQPSGEPVSVTDTGAGGAAAQVTEPQEPTTPRTPEEIEAEWRHRVSQNDKAHQKEAAALREQVSRFQAAEEQRRRAEEAERQSRMTAEERVQDQIKTLERQLEQERVGRVIDARKLRFPNITAELDEQAIAVMDEGKLAALESKLTGQTAQPPSLIDPNSAARAANGTPVTPREKTSDELKQDLHRLGPEFARELANR